MHIYLDRIIIQQAAEKTCVCFDIDPYKAISEGTLLATAVRDKAQDIVGALKGSGIPAGIVGEVVSEKEGMFIFDKNKKYRLRHPKTDPFWAKFEEYLKNNAR